MALELKHITFGFSPEKQILKDLSLSFEKGKIYALAGANGAGKSTLAKILNGELSPQAGEIFFKNKKVDLRNPKQAKESGIVKVSQEYGLISNLTIADNILLAKNESNHKIFYDKNQNKELVEKTLSIFNKKIDTTLKISETDISIHPFVSVAKAIIQNPELLILDETTAILTKNDTATFFEYLRKLKNEGKTIIIVTHKLDEVFEIADEVLVLRNGNLVLKSESTKVSVTEIANAMLGNGKHLGKIENKLQSTDDNSFLKIENLNSHKLKNISFELRKGEVLGLISKDKNELNEITDFIFGITQQANGKIWKDGKQIFLKTPLDAIKNGIGYLTDDKKESGLFYNLNIADNISFLQKQQNSFLGFIQKKKLNHFAKTKISELNIDATSTSQSVEELSGGNQQKTLFAKWLSIDFDILILIEPTAGVDIGGKSEIYSLICELKSRGKSFILVSTEWNEIENICDRILVIENGKEVKTITRENFSEKEIYDYTF